MFTYKHLRTIFFLLVGLTILTACSQASSFSSASTDAVLPVPLPTWRQPTDTQPLPTDNLPPSTSTTLPPTATLLPATPTSWPQVIVPGPNDIQALLLLPNGVGPNWYLNADNFETYGWLITLAGVKEAIAPCPTAAGWYGLPDVLVDRLVDDITNLSQFQVIAIMPATKKNANAFTDLSGSQAALSLLQTADQAGTTIFAACGGVSVLAKAGVLAGHQITGEARYTEQYQAAGAVYLGEEILPVIDGNIVTTVEGLHSNQENCTAVAAALENQLAGDPSDPIKEVQTVSFVIPERDTAWTHTYGGSSADGAQALLQTSDGGFILAGYSFSFGASYANAYLVRADAAGSLLWSNTYGGLSWEYLLSVAETADGGFVAAGYTTSSGAGSMDMYLLRIDAQGKELWSRTFGGAGQDVAQAVTETPDGSLLLAGYTNSHGAGKDDVYVVKTDAAGNEQWSQTYGDKEPDLAMDILVDSQGNYLVAGATGSFQANKRDVYVIKLDPDGNILWSQLYGQSDDFLSFDWGNDIIEVSTGGYLIVGNTNLSTQATSGELMNVYLVRIDTQGKLLWTASTGRGQFYDYGNAVIELPNGEFLVAGATKTRSNNNEIFLARLSSEGVTLDARGFGDFGSEWGSAIALSSDGAVALAGQTNSFGAGSFDIWLLLVPVE